MKQPKKLTLKYKKLLKKKGLVPDEWMLVKDFGNTIVIVNKKNKETKEIIAV